MPFVKELPEWNAQGAAPSSEAKNNGWGPNQHPPADWFNWIQNKTYEALKEIREKAALKEDISDVDLTPLQTKVNEIEQTVSEHQANDVNHVKYAVATGTANTYVITLNPAPTAYVEGMALSVKINVNATATSTLNVNGLGAKVIKKANGTDVTNLKANGIYTLRYDGVNFILQGEDGSGNAIASDLLSGKTASTDAGDIVGTMPNRGTFNLALGATVPAGYYSGGNAPNGKKWTSGTGTIGGTGALTVNGLAFQPSVVICKSNDANHGAVTAIYAKVGSYLVNFTLYSANGSGTDVNTIYSDGFKVTGFYDGSSVTWIAFE